MDRMMRVFLGFDQAEAVSWSVFAYSIQRHASIPVQIAPIMLSQLKSEINRPWDSKQSNEFAFSRWLVPYLCGYEGWAMFADCDMLCTTDLAELWALRDNRFAVMTVQHGPLEVGETKYLGRPQTPYKRKNWSSVMLFNCTKCKALTPHYVNTAHGLHLHQFKWLKEKKETMGALPLEWNYLIGGYYPIPEKTPKIIHWTNGGPWFLDYADVPYSELWNNEFALTVHSEQLSRVKPGGSLVHIQV